MPTDIYFDAATTRRLDKMVKRIDAIEAADSVDRAAQNEAYLALDEFTPSEQEYVGLALDKLAADRNKAVEPEGGWYVVPKPERRVEAPRPVVSTEPRQTRTRVNDGDVNLLAEAILSVIGAKDALTKGEVLKRVGGEAPKASVWNKAIASLLENNKVQVNGKKRGARYSLFGKKVTIKRLMPEDDAVIVAKSKICKALDKIGEPAGRAKIFETMGEVIPQDVWMMAVTELEKTDGKIVKTGIKRGAKYRTVR